MQLISFKFVIAIVPTNSSDLSITTFQLFFIFLIVFLTFTYQFSFIFHFIFQVTFPKTIFSQIMYLNEYISLQICLFFLIEHTVGLYFIDIVIVYPSAY